MAERGLVVDASVALKWVIDERGTSEALRLLDRATLHAPDFLLVEVANVLWSKVQRRVLATAEADVAYHAVASVPMVLAPLAELTPHARVLAFELNVTVYDAVYAAVALRVGCPLATADRQLAQAIERAGSAGAALLIE